MNYNRRTSEGMASLASNVLNDPRSSATCRQLAASVLSQAAPADPRGIGQRRTSKEMATLAAIILASSHSPYFAKELAGSVLSQRAL
ncbi:hypothetical protein NUACC21_80020 [Scytonema sp. NUACC21]